MKKNEITRRSFMYSLGNVGVGMGLAGIGFGCSSNSDKQKGLPKDSNGNVIEGFEKAEKTNKKWEPFSDKKVKVGIAGYGFCKFGACFEFQNHPNVEVVAVSDLDDGRCNELAKACNCKKKYPSCEEMIKDKSIEAIFIATDAPSHSRLAIEALNNGKHVASVVPAVFGLNALEEAQKLHDAVKNSGKKYMMFETTTYRESCYRNRMQYMDGELGKVIYSEGEYYHYFGVPLGSFNPKNGKIDLNGWRRGLPPMWYPTHSMAFYNLVSDGYMTQVSCLGMKSIVDHLKPENNSFKNPFGTEIALLRTSEGGMSRMAVSWDTPGHGGETGRVFGQKKTDKYNDIDVRPALPIGVEAGGHGGAHGHLTNNFIESILLDKEPIVNIDTSLNLTISGVIAHMSALENGKWMDIPRFS